MRRRDFITLLSGAVAWPAVAHAQQSDRLRRVGILMGFGENDSEGILWLSSFIRTFRELGWTDGRNVRLEIRWGASDLNQQRTYARELVRLDPMSSSPMGPRQPLRYSRRHRQFQLCLPPFPTPLVKGLLKAWRGLVAI